MEARGYPFNKKGVLCCCCIPVPLQPRLLTLQLQLEALQDLPFPLPVQSCSQRNQDTEILLWTWLFPGEHACKWLSFLLAQCKFFSVGISVWCCFAAWSWQGFVAQKGQKLCQVKLQMYDPTTCQSKSLCRLIYSAFSPHDDDGCTPSSKHWGTPNAPALCAQKEQKLLLSVEQGNSIARKFCWQMQLTEQLTGIAWHLVFICICLNELGKS